MNKIRIKYFRAVGGAFLIVCFCATLVLLPLYLRGVKPGKHFTLQQITTWVLNR